MPDTFRCRHFSIGNVRSASCGVCGPLAADPPVPNQATVVWSYNPPQPPPLRGV